MLKENKFAITFVEQYMHSDYASLRRLFLRTPENSFTNLLFRYESVHDNLHRILQSAIQPGACSPRNLTSNEAPVQTSEKEFSIRKHTVIRAKSMRVSVGYCETVMTLKNKTTKV